MKPIVKRVLKWLGWGFLALVALALAFSLLWRIGFRWGLTPLPKPPLGVRIEPLRPPLTAENIKADNAAYYYLQAGKRMKGYKQSKASEEDMDALLAGDISGNTKAIERTLADCAKSLQLVRKGANVKSCQMPMLNPDDKTSGYMPQLKQLARLLCCVGELARRDGNYEQARDEYLTVVKFGRDCAAGGDLLTMLVGNAISDMGTKGLRTLMLENALPTDTNKAAAVELMRLEADFPPLAETLRYELIQAKQMVDASCIMTNFPANSRAAFRGTMFRLFDAAYGDVIQEAQKPYWQSDMERVIRKWVPEKLKWLMLFNRPVPRLMLSMCLPTLEPSFSFATRHSADRRATAVVCALTRYAHVHGKPPERLDQLVPDFLPAVPIDPFDGKPLRYRREGAGWVVWSVGSDMKDDNAAWHESKYRKYGETPRGGDIYFKSTEPADDLAWYHAHRKTQAR